MGRSSIVCDRRAVRRPSLELHHGDESDEGVDTLVSHEKPISAVEEAPQRIAGGRSQGAVRGMIVRI